MDLFEIFVHRAVGGPLWAVTCITDRSSQTC
jgi:hypothetical protein